MSPARKARSRLIGSSGAVLAALLVMTALAQSGPIALHDLFGTGTWTVASVTFEGEDASVGAGQESVFVINVDGHLAGSVGCNQMIAMAELEPGGAVSIGPVTSTLMACPEPAMSLERSFVAALEAVESFSREAGTVTLSGPGAEVVFVQVDTGAPGEDEEGAAGGVDVAAFDSFNSAVVAAGRAGAAWVHDPLRVAMAFAELHGGQSTLIQQDLPMAEGSEEATVSIEERGLLDDSIEGVSQVVTLERSDYGWVVVDALVTWFCRRGPQPAVVSPARCD